MFNGSENAHGRILRAVRSRSARPTRTAPPTPTAPTTSRTCRPPRSTWRCGWNPTAWATCSARSTRRRSTSSAAWCRTKSARARTSPTARSSRRHLPQAMYPKAHPYHHSTIGSMADLNAASLDDVKGWFRTWYGPNNAVLVLAGDIDVATAKAQGREVLRRHPGDADDAAAEGRCRRARQVLARDDDRQGAAGAHLSRLERGRVRPARSRPAAAVRAGARRQQELAPGHAPAAPGQAGRQRQRRCLWHRNSARRSSSWPTSSRASNRRRSRR